MPSFPDSYCWKVRINGRCVDRSFEAPRMSPDTLENTALLAVRTFCSLEDEGRTVIVTLEPGSGHTYSDRPHTFSVHIDSRVIPEHRVMAPKIVKGVEPALRKPLAWVDLWGEGEP